jgi:deazaflavin-dependent oxidoreductase (nitroreductase family)
MPTDEALETDRRVVEQFRAGDPVDGMHRDRLLLLTTRGRRSGRVRTTPMMFFAGRPSPSGPVRRVVMASGNGAPSDPAWYLNLVAEPRVHVEVADQEYDAVARVAVGDERELLWAEVTAAYPFFHEHQEAARREIPLVVLDPS